MNEPSAAACEHLRPDGCILLDGCECAHFGCTNPSHVTTRQVCPCFGFDGACHECPELHSQPPCKQHLAHFCPDCREWDGERICPNLPSAAASGEGSDRG